MNINHTCFTAKSQAPRVAEFTPLPHPGTKLTSLKKSLRKQKVEAFKQIRKRVHGKKHFPFLEPIPIPNAKKKRVRTGAA